MVLSSIEERSVGVRVGGGGRSQSQQTVEIMMRARREMWRGVFWKQDKVLKAAVAAGLVVEYGEDSLRARVHFFFQSSAKATQLKG
jgi:hypothetical protein